MLDLTRSTAKIVTRFTGKACDAGMGETRDAHRILVGKYFRNIFLKIKTRWIDNATTDLE
jgi:hypothetical protein